MYWSSLYGKEQQVRQSNKTCDHKKSFLRGLIENGIVKIDFVRSKSNDSDIFVTNWKKNTKLSKNFIKLNNKPYKFPNTKQERFPKVGQTANIFHQKLFDL